MMTGGVSPKVYSVSSFPGRVSVCVVVVVVVVFPETPAVHTITPVWSE